LAEKLVTTSIDYGARRDQLFFEVRAKCSKVEFEAIRRGVGRVMDTGYIDIMCPIFTEHPDLKSEQWRRDDNGDNVP